MRLAIDAPIDEEAVFLAFSKQLSGGLARRVQARQEAKEMDGHGSVTWAEVVRAAREMRHQLSAGTLANEPDLPLTATS